MEFSMQTYFDQLDRVRYEGPKSTNPLAFRHYNPDELVLGKRMEDHLRFAACYWHTFCWNGADMFGVGSFDRPGSSRATPWRWPNAKPMWRLNSSTN
jgi:xylose isomerase